MICRIWGQFDPLCYQTHHPWPHFDFVFPKSAMCLWFVRRWPHYLCGKFQTFTNISALYISLYHCLLHSVYISLHHCLHFSTSQGPLRNCHATAVNAKEAGSTSSLGMFLILHSWIHWTCLKKKFSRLYSLRMIHCFICHSRCETQYYCSYTQ